MIVPFVVAMTVQSAVSPLSILDEVGDFNRLTHSANYTYAQASSYDRASVKPGIDSWFANADYGQFVRTETTKGRSENVMADLTGPGAVVRVWSANPQGIIRFYFDGETQPRIECDFQKLFLDALAPSEFGYVSARGFNLYIPMTYKKSLKITLEGPNSNRVYYHVGYRTYPAGTPISTFDLITSYDMINGAVSPRGPVHPVDPRVSVLPLSRLQGKPALTGSGVVISLTLDLMTTKPHWRDIPIQIEVDGETTIDSTVGDLFGCPESARSFDSQGMAVTTPDTRLRSGQKAMFTLKLPQPYSRSFEVRIAGSSELSGDLILTSVNQIKSPRFRLFSQTHNHKGPTRPFRDMNIVNAHGQGRYVGTVLTLENPVGGWWGEGDEKVFVNQEKFPSIFGTGTEDYFGYAWSSNEVFQALMNGQPRADGPANYGHITNYRWHTFDDIPFKDGLRFDLEMWHWIDTDTRFTTTAFWYGEPGKTKITQSELPTVRELLAGKPVPGAIEGESMKVQSPPPGIVEVQGDFLECSGLKQLWWKDARLNDKLDISFSVERAGRYRIEAHLCQARDYGKHRIEINGKDGGAIDFYSSELKWTTHDLGIHDLSAGQSMIRVTCLGQNVEAEPRRMFGLDYIKLIPVADPTISP